jgi:hypothetical protein
MAFAHTQCERSGILTFLPEQRPSPAGRHVEAEGGRGRGSAKCTSTVQRRTVGNPCNVNTARQASCRTLRWRAVCTRRCCFGRLWRPFSLTAIVYLSQADARPRLPKVLQPTQPRWKYKDAGTVTVSQPFGCTHACTSATPRKHQSDHVECSACLISCHG